MGYWNSVAALVSRPNGRTRSSSPCNSQRRRCPDSQGRSRWSHSHTRLRIPRVPSSGHVPPPPRSDAGRGVVLLATADQVGPVVGC